MKSIDEIRIIKNLPHKTFPIYEAFVKRYNVTVILSLSKMIHKWQGNERELSTASFTFSILLKHLNYYIGLKLNKDESYYQRREQQLSLSKISIDSLLNENNALHNLVNALWRIYHSNNLRLSHSFFRLIHAITEQKVNFKELMPLTGVIQNFLSINNILEKEIQKIQTVLPITDVIRREMVMRNIFSVSSGAVPKVNITRKSEFNILPIHEKTMELFSKQKYFKTMLFTGGGVTPLLQNIYESIESNSLFYNSSIYQSARTLYRLTNSLWRVYNSQNLELSRSFIRLINTVTEVNMEIRHKKTVSGLFSTSNSLHNLIYALRRAFSGNNLQLRQSLITLIRDINVAGKNQTNTNLIITKRQIDKNHFLFNPVNVTETERYFSGVYRRGDYRYSLMLYRLFLPFNERVRNVNLYHPVEENHSLTENFSLKNTENLIDEKLKGIKAETDKIKVTDALIRKISDRIKEEQRDEIRYEKLKRGMF